MSNHKKPAAVCIFLLIAIAGLAQNNTRSPYSARGIGEIEPFANAYSKSLGGTSNGIRSSRMISLSNPASLGGLSLVSFDFGFRGEGGLAFTDKAKQTYYNGNFNYLVLGFPVWQKELIKDTAVSRKKTSASKNNLIKVYKTLWCSAVGITPYSSVGSSYYKIYDTTYGKVANFYSKSGGLTRAFIMNAFNLNKNISLGANVSYVFGPLVNNRAFFIQDSGVSRALYDESIHHLKGFKFDFGYQSQHRDTFVIKDSVMLNNKRILRVRRIPFKFIFGATYSNQSSLRYSLTRMALNKNNYYTYGTVDTLINENNVKGKTHLPSEFSAGFSFTYNNKWLLAFDYSSTLWANTKQTLFTDQFTNSSQYAIGLAYRPDLEPVSGLKKTKNPLEYRFGFRTLNTGYNYKDNNGNIQPLKEYAITFGIGIPKSRQNPYPRMDIKSMINITGEYIHRGSTMNGMVEERLFRLTVGITLGDVWFIKRKFQ